MTNLKLPYGIKKSNVTHGLTHSVCMDFEVTAEIAEKWQFNKKYKKTIATLKQL